MSTQPPEPYKQPTRHQLMDQISAMGPALRLYRASNDWWAAKYQGEKFWFPPDLGGSLVMHPATREYVRADGIHEVRSRTGTLYTEAKLGQPMRRSGHGVRPGMHASEIAAFLIDKYAKVGVVMLTGNEAQDIEAKNTSRRLVYQFIKAWADREIAARAEFKAKFEANPKNANLRMPDPTAPQRRAQEWLDSNALAEGTLRYSCEYGCYATDDYEQYRRHMLAAHKQDTPPTPVNPAAEANAATPAADTEALRALIAEVEALKQNLSEREAKIAAREAEIEDRTARRQKKKEAEGAAP